MLILRSLRGIGRALVDVAVVAWILLAIAILVLRYAVLPDVDRYRGDVERLASRASGETVRIGAIEASWPGISPRFVVRDVTVVDANGATTLTLPSVRGTLSWRSLVALQPRFASLEVDGVNLDVRRDAAGQLFVAGYPIRKRTTPDSQAAEFLLAQDDVRIAGATVTWRDEMNEPGSAPSARRPFVLTDVAFELRRSGSRHRAALHATPPASLAAPLDVRASIDHPLFATRLADPAAWSGEVYADVATGDVVAWREWLPLPSTVDDGRGRARVWATFARADAPAGVFAKRLATRIKRPIPPELDRIASVTADLALDDVAVHWGTMADAPEYAAIGSIDGRIVGSQSMTEQHFAAQHMALQPRTGTKVPPTDFDMHRAIGGAIDDETGTASLGAIDIGVSLGLVPAPLVPPAIAEKLAALKPRGTLEHAAVKWTGAIAAPRTFDVDARFANVAIAPQAPTAEAIAAAARTIVGANGLVRRPRPAFGQPGIVNLSGSVTATRTAGADAQSAVTTATVAIAGNDTSIVAPGLFDEPTIRLAHLNAAVGIRVDGGDVEVKVDHASLDNPDLAAEVDVLFRHGPKSGGLVDADGKPGRGWLDVNAKVTRADVGRVPRYLPNIIGERARLYLSRALIAGRVEEATMHLRGPLEKLNLREMPDALAKPDPVPVREALIRVRDGSPRAAGARGNAPTAAPDDALLHAVVKVRNATYQYGPARRPGDPLPLSGVQPSPTSMIAWPTFEDVDADVVFDEAKMTVHARSARVYGYRLTDITAELPALADPSHVLRVSGKGTGPLQDLVHFINESPISRWLHRFTDTTQATGDAALALALDLPLSHPRDAALAGSVRFMTNDLALNAIIPPLRKIDGRMDFTDRGLAIDGLTAEALGGPLRVDAKTGSDGWIDLGAKGTVDVGVLQNEARQSRADGLETPVSSAVERAARFLSGRANYSVALRVRSKRAVDLSDGVATAPDANTPTQPDLVVQSDLVGLAISLPEPLTKPADASWPLRIELARSTSAGAAAPDREDIRIALADRIDVDIARKRNAQDPQDRFAVTRAGYRVGGGDATGTGPSDVTVTLPSLDADAWREALREAGPPAATTAKPPSDAFDRLLPEHATLKTAQLRATGRDFTNVDVTAERTAAGWRANVAADQVAGTLSYTDVSGQTATRTGVAPASTGKLVVRLDRLSIPPAEPGAVRTASPLDASKQRDFPAIDAIVERFELRGRTLGRLEVVAENVDAGDGTPGDREWRLEKLGLTTPEARFDAHGVWGRIGADEKTSLDFTLDSSNVGALLDRLGVVGTIRNGTAQLSGNAAWNGGPTTIDFGSMSGSLKLAADKGQFLKAEPGIAKLLNILSLQGLARRLTLDFNDVFDAGFAFDTVRADAKVEHGIATTDDFTMRGVQALVTMRGSADLGHETADLHVRIEPQINAGAASLGLAVVNPVLGLATFAAQYFFKDRISQALAFEYNVEGPWAKPNVTKIDRKGRVTTVLPKKTVDAGGASTKAPIAASSSPAEPARAAP